MKKFLLTLLLVLSFTLVSAQTEFTRTYTKTCTIEKDKAPLWRDATNKFIFNYDNQPSMKMLMADGTIKFFDQVSDLEKNRTEGGSVYQLAMFKEQGTEFIFYLQIFDDTEYGTRIIFDDGTMIQFTN